MGGSGHGARGGQLCQGAELAGKASVSGNMHIVADEERLVLRRGHLKGRHFGKGL